MASSGVLALLLFVAGPAQAGPPKAPDPAAVKAARDHLAHGKKLIARERYAQAIEQYLAAEALVSAPEHWLMMGRLHAQMGDLLAAEDDYQKASGFDVGPGTPLSRKRSVGVAAKELEAMRQRVPQLRIAVTGRTASQILLDGEVVDDASTPARLNPGKHRCEARGEGAVPAAANVVLEEGDRALVQLVLVDEAGAPPPPPPPPRPDHPAVGAGWVVLALGIGAAGVVAGSVTGALSLSRAHDLGAQCGSDGTTCPASARDTIDEAKLFGHISTASFAVGGTGIAVGVVLLLVRASNGAEAAELPFALRPGPGGAAAALTF